MPRFFSDDQLVEWKGLPTTLEEAKEQLTLLFTNRQWIDNSKECMERALTILQAYPSLAEEKFSFPSIGVCLGHNNQNKSYPPVCHFFRAEDVEMIRAVYHLFPSSILEYLHIAFFLHTREHKKLLISFLDMHPKARYQYRPLPFISYLQVCMLTQLRPHVNVRTVRDISDLLWCDELLQQPWTHGLVSQLGSDTLPMAIYLECHPVIDYLLDKLPDIVWSPPPDSISEALRIEFYYNGFGLPAVRALQKLLRLSRLKHASFCVTIFDEPSKETFCNLAEALAQDHSLGKKHHDFDIRLPPEDDRDAAVLGALENCISGNKSIQRLGLEWTRDFPTMRAIANGIAGNNTIQSLHLVGYYQIHLDEPQSIEEGLVGLLQNSTKNLTLDRLFIKPWNTNEGHRIAQSKGMQILEISRLQDLTVQGCLFEGTGFDCFVECLFGLPALTKLQIKCESHYAEFEAPLGTANVTGGLLVLLKQNRLKQLEVSAYVLDVVHLCAELEATKSLLFLKLEVSLQSHIHSLVNLMMKRRTLVCSSDLHWDLDEQQWPALDLESVHYNALLNQAGREKASNPETTKEAFVDLLLDVLINETPAGPLTYWYADKYNSNPLQDPAMKASIVNGLLREQPSLWCANRASRGTKRKAIKKQERPVGKGKQRVL